MGGRLPGSTVLVSICRSTRVTRHAPGTARDAPPHNNIYSLKIPRSAVKPCQLPLTVTHLLVDCTNVHKINHKYVTASSLKAVWKMSTITISPIYYRNCSVCYLHSCNSYMALILQFYLRLQSGILSAYNTIMALTINHVSRNR